MLHQYVLYGIATTNTLPTENHALKVRTKNAHGVSKGEEKMNRKCGLPLPVKTPKLYCKKCNQDLVIKYAYEGPENNTPVLACPSCGAIDWWGDEDFNLDIVE